MQHDSKNPITRHSGAVSTDPASSSDVNKKWRTTVQSTQASDCSIHTARTFLWVENKTFWAPVSELVNEAFFKPTNRVWVFITANESNTAVAQCKVSVIIMNASLQRLKSEANLENATFVCQIIINPLQCMCEL